MEIDVAFWAQQEATKTAFAVNSLERDDGLLSIGRVSFEELAQTEMKLSWKQVTANLVGWPHFWQLPAQTEKHAFEMASAVLPEIEGVSYIGFPWATLIDLLEKGYTEKAKPFLEALRTVPSLPHGRKVTVSQHVLTCKYGNLFALAGISDLFWSHKNVNRSRLENIALHPFPLYPVQQLGPENGKAKLISSRSHLFSFVGLGNHPGYPTEVRKAIAEIANADGAYIRLRDEWHYEKQVYLCQIQEQALPPGEEKRLHDNEVEFKEAIGNSVFCLCPSGTGPNTIRLWEALAAGTIPVILSADCDLPGGANMWNEAAIIEDESRETLIALPERLVALRSNHIRLQAMAAAGRKIWESYGPQRFIHDVLTLFYKVARNGTSHSWLAEANHAYRNGEFRKALGLYMLAQNQYPALAEIYQNNVNRARRKLGMPMGANEGLEG